MMGTEELEKASWTERAVKTLPAALSYELEMPQVLKFLRGVIKATALLFFYKAMYHPPPWRAVQGHRCPSPYFILKKKKKKETETKEGFAQSRGEVPEQEELGKKGKMGEDTAGGKMDVVE